MTRRLRPPMPLRAHCHPGDGRPLRLYHGGRARTVTHIAATWVRPAAWWSSAEAGNHDPDLEPSAASILDEERTYFRVVLDGALVQEIFCTASGSWYLERIID